MAAFGVVSKKWLQPKTHCVTLDDIQSAEGNIRKLGIGVTPVMTSTTMNELSGHDLYFKCELFQKTGSFKSRGASNACYKLEVGMPVVTHSSGNHAQAIAFAAKATGRSATVIMPSTAPLIKQRATESYGATVQICQPQNRASEANLAAEALGAELIHPSENPNVIAGQGTVALELLEQVSTILSSVSGQSDVTPPSLNLGPPLDAIIIPVGGGGLLSGCAVYCKSKWPNMLVVGAEPLAMNDAARSLQSGCIQENLAGATTIADGLRTQLGPNTWPTVRDFVDTILTVEEEDIISATALVWSRMKLQIEPSAGVGVACAMSSEFRSLMQSKNLGRTARVGVVLCGGNVDIISLAPILGKAKSYPSGANVVAV